MKWILVLKRAALFTGSLLLSTFLICRGYAVIENFDSLLPLMMCLLLSVSLNLTTFALCMCDDLLGGLRSG